MFSQNLFHQWWQLRLASLLALVGVITGANECAKAQIVPDNTLGQESSVVTPLAPNFDQINGGATRGANLFHSFEQFNIGEGRRAVFTNPSGIENIISRVTGGNRSEIFGTLSVRGSANLFLINPNGIIFGPNARLSVGGSFDSVELSGTSPDGKTFSTILTQTDGAGDADALRIETGRLIVQGGARVSTATTDSGKGGTLVVRASDSVQLIGTSTSADNPSPSGLFALAEGFGKPGDLMIETRQLIVRDGARASASNTGSAQLGGTLTVTASESVQLIGTSANGRDRSGLLVGTTGTGTAGKLTIETKKLQVLDGAFVSARTVDEGPGGSVMVNASNSVELIGTSADGQPSLLTTETTGVGDAGNLTIETGQLTIKDGAQITSSSTGLGRAGDAQVQANSLGLDQGRITSQTTSGNGGNITLSVKDLLLLRRGSEISTTAGTERKGGDGGNITINAPNGFIVARPGENSDITANAFEGSGGRVTINATDIYGIAPLSRQELERLRADDLDPRKLQTNDITAISQTNPSLSGTIEINTPDVDLNSALINLPSVPVDTKLAQGCNSPNYAKSSFIITGRGGLPMSPTEPLQDTSTLSAWVRLRPRPVNSAKTTISPQPTAVSNSTKVATAATPIVEATGWVFGPGGEVIFTAQAPTQHQSSWQTPPKCHEK